MEELNNQQQNGADSTQNALSLVDIWNIIWGNKWWFVAGIIVCVFCAGIYLYRTPSTFSRSAKLIVDESAQDAAVRNLSSFTGGGMRLRNTVAVENEMEAFTSPDLMEIVVERNGLQTVYVEKQFVRDVELYRNTPLELKLGGNNPTKGFSFNVRKDGDSTFVLSDFRIGRDKIKEKVQGNVGDTLSTPVGTISLHPTLSFDKWKNDILISWANPMARAKAYCANLSANISSKESTVLVLNYKDKFPSRAENILNSLIDVYNEVWLYDKNRAARNTSTFITERLGIIENELGGIEGDLKAYKASNNLTDLKAVAQQYLEESSTYAEKLFEVNNQLSIATFIKDYLNDPAHATDLIPSNSGIASTSVESQIGEYNKLILQRDRYKSAGSENPMVADLNVSIASMRSAILRSIDNLVATLNLQADGLKQQEDQVLKRISSSSGQEYELLSMTRQQKVKESLYIFLLQKREENEITALVNVGNTRVIMRPNGSPNPVAPRKAMILLLALIMGCAIPFAWFFLRIVLDTTVKTRQDLASLKVPFLAEIPHAVLKRGKFSFIRRFGKKKAADEDGCRIVVKAGKRNMMNEAYRVLRTNLDLMLGKKGSHVIMLTSFYPNAGKTYNIMNIAAAMSIKPARVVLVDLDLRKASLSKALNINTVQGVSSYLNGDIHDLSSVTVNVAKNLDCLPVGVLPPNPTELLLSDVFPKMVDELKEKYDYVFIDCPPIEIVADSAIVTQYVDMTLFVARAGLFDKRLMPKINELYEQNKYKHMCIVLNGVQMEYKPYAKSGNGYGYGYGYGYGNDSDDSEEIE